MAGSYGGLDPGRDAGRPDDVRADRRVMLGLNRQVERVFNPDRKDHHGAFSGRHT
jgi:hypothetical protein